MKIHDPSELLDRAFFSSLIEFWMDVSSLLSSTFKGVDTSRFFLQCVNLKCFCGIRWLSGLEHSRRWNARTRYLVLKYSHVLTHTHQQEHYYWICTIDLPHMPMGKTFNSYFMLVGNAIFEYFLLLDPWIFLIIVNNASFHWQFG